MDLESLIASLSPDGAADAMPAPMALPSMPPPDAGGAPAAPALPSSASAPLAAILPPGGSSGMPQPGTVHQTSGGIAEHLQEMLPMLIAGLMSGAALKNPGPYGRSEDIGALAQGLLHGYTVTNAGKLAARQQGTQERRLSLEEQRMQQGEADRQADRATHEADRQAERASRQTETDLKHKELKQNFLRSILNDADQHFADDPAGRAAYLEQMGQIWRRTWNEDAPFANMPVSGDASGKKLQKDAKSAIGNLKELYGDKFLDPMIQDSNIKPEVARDKWGWSGEEPMKVRHLLALAEPSMPDAAPTPIPPKTGDDFDKYLKTTYMPEKGITGRAPTRAEVLAARKEWQEAGSTADPEMHNLTKELAKQRLKDAQDKNTGIGEITEGTPEYRLAENLAFGKTTLAQAKGLYSGRESKGKETLRAVLDKAEQINPNFNAALFEQGYKFASNPKTQMAMVALNRVEPNIDKLIALSDKWDRTKYPSANAFLRAVGYQWGSRNISDFGQLQTIVGDELGPALGVGAATDLKTKLGLDMAGGSAGKENFRSNLGLVKDALKNQRIALTGQMGPYGGADKNSVTTPDTPPAAGKKNPFRP